MQTIGDRLKALREKAGIKQKEMAEYLGLKLPGYNRIENGYVDITLKHLVAIRNRFNVSLDWLISGIEAQSPADLPFAEFSGTVKQMLKDMEQEPAFLHGMLSQYHEMKQKKATKDNGNDKVIEHGS